ncbi:hypothetical protein ES708_25411 [subsurface metagenome]
MHVRKIGQTQGHRGFGVTGNDQQGPEKLIPGPHKLDNGQGCKGGFYHRQYDIPENPKLRAAVNTSGIDIVVGQGGNPFPHQQDSECTYHQRQKQRKKSIHKFKLFQITE